MRDSSRANALNDSQQSVDKRLLANLQAKVAWTFLRALEKAQHGTLTLILPDGSAQTFGVPAAGQPDAVLRIHRYNALKRVMTAGDIGFAEGYLAGDWDSPDPVKVLGFAIANDAALQDFASGGPIANLYHKLLHRMRKNSKRGSRRNIASHYDLGNEFYAHWLDPGLTYSSAYFSHRQEDLQSAQENKLRRALRKLNLGRGAEILEIGCGWGSMAEMAVREFGHRITGLTLSREQLAFATERLHNSGLGERARFLYQDYRDMRARFDGIVSIEMFEAVGMEHWRSYFDTLKRCLRPGGRAVIQTIVINDDKFESYLGETDFIQKYVFPGGMLPSPKLFREYGEKAGLQFEGEECFGASYAKTLCLWRDAFENAWNRIESHEFDEQFRRLWRYYLIYCEAGFRYRNIDVGQYIFTAPK